MVLVLASGRWFIRLLRRRQVLEAQENRGSERLDALHAHKSSTPTLGGVLLFGGVLLSVVLWGRLDDTGVLLLCGYTIVLAALGYLDDTRKLRTGKKGLSARGKLLWEVGLSAIVGLVLYLSPPPATFAQVQGDGGTGLFLPLLGAPPVELGIGFVLLVIVVTTGTANAVNLTDGLDGLAAGISTLVALCLAFVALSCGRSEAAVDPRIPHVANGHEVAVFVAALAGGGLGFLWFNCHPAQVFMGDTGALPLGGALGLAAILTKQEVVLFLAGGVLVAEALSVILQVASYKTTGKRVFLIAPLHHHFQFKGWPETKVTIRFWIVGAMLAWISVAVLRLG